MEVTSRGVEAAVAEQDLDGPQVGAVLQQVSGEAVPKRMYGDVLVQPRGEARRLAGVIDGPVCDRSTGDISREEPGTGLVDLAAPVRFPVFPQQGQQPGREHDEAILGSLGL